MDGMFSDLDFTGLSDDYASKQGIYDPERAAERAELVRKWLRERPEQEIVCEYQNFWAFCNGAGARPGAACGIGTHQPIAPASEREIVTPARRRRTVRPGLSASFGIPHLASFGRREVVWHATIRHCGALVLG